MPPSRWRRVLTAVEGIATRSGQTREHDRIVRTGTGTDHEAVRVGRSVRRFLPPVSLSCAVSVHPGLQCSPTTLTCSARSCSPTGMLARSGSYAVRSRVIDDDGTVYADFEWTFKLGKEW